MIAVASAAALVLASVRSDGLQGLASMRLALIKGGPRRRS
ncbi:hypothetical protein GA0070213_114171 [Micromonospora humi]|uniref:Uncharacterized protein n=1 Tax=Micromonospora humi TaxID=745366 RepID=A0A1C5JW94_9ACTN|nr:hypothetical protein GA0070213_114171 [Micromonospora humi]